MPASKTQIKLDFQTAPAATVFDYIQLMRLDTPIGFLLLLWPTLWSLWLAAGGLPSLKNFVIFTLGCLFMRSAGCVINDYADRHFDGHVARTRNRPLATGRIKPVQALLLFGALCGLSALLLLFCNRLTAQLALVALVLAVLYPFCKRHSALPQVVLGAAFAWAIPMAWAAQTGTLKPVTWLLFCAALLWTLVYDTFYAMVDRDDDAKLGLRSTAILFGEADRVITAFLQAFFLVTLLLLGKQCALGYLYYIALCLVVGLFGWQQWLIRLRQPAACFRAFLNNQWVGLVIFAGIAADYALRAAHG